MLWREQRREFPLRSELGTPQWHLSGCVLTRAQVHWERLAPALRAPWAGGSRGCLCHRTLKTQIHQALPGSQYQSLFPSKSREQIASKTVIGGRGWRCTAAISEAADGWPAIHRSLSQPPPPAPSYRQTQTLCSLSSRRVARRVRRLHH